MDELAAVSSVVRARLAAAPRQLLSGQLASQPEDVRGTTTLCNSPATDAAPALRGATSAGRRNEADHA